MSTGSSRRNKTSEFQNRARRRSPFNDDWQEIRREALFLDLKQRIRDVEQGPDGLLYVLTDEQDGALLKLEPVQ